MWCCQLNMSIKYKVSVFCKSSHSSTFHFTLHPKFNCVPQNPLILTSVFSRYTTAYAESDYTDRDSDRDEGGRESEQESEEDRSCITVLTLRQEDSQEEEMEERELLEEEEEEEKDEQLVIEAPPNGELALLLAQSDILHTGDATLKAEGFRLLLDNRAEVRDDYLTDLMS